MAERFKIEVRWLAASGDPSKLSLEGAQERAKVVDALRAAGVTFTYPDPIMAFDSVDLSFTTIIVPLGVASISALGVIAGAFLQARFGRKVRIKVGDVEAEASNFEDVERLLEKAASFQDRNHGGEK